MNNPASVYQFRIDAKEKADTFAIFQEMGLKPAQAIRLFFRQVRQTNALPFNVEHTPNAKTAQALLANPADKDYQRFDSVAALMADLNN